MPTDKTATQETSFNIIQVQNLLNKGIPIMETSRGKELILTIGESGAGKTTLLAYLLGHKIIEKQIIDEETGEPLDWVYDTESPVEGLRIGHDGFSQTLFPRSFTKFDISWYYTDCAGFDSNRPLEQRIVESISTELAIKVSKGIAGILIVIPYQHVAETRTIGQFKKLIITLMQLFKSPEKMFEKATFVISRMDDTPINKAKNNVNGALNRHIKFCNEKIKNLNKNPDKQYADDALSLDEIILFKLLLEKLKKRFNDIVFAEKLTESKDTQYKIESSIEKMKGQDNDLMAYEEFNFSKYDEYRTKFNTAVFMLADFYITIMKQIQENYDNINHYHLRIQELEAEIDEIKRNIQEYENEEFDSVAIDRTKNNLKAYIDEKKKKIEKNDEEIQGIEGQINLKSQERDALDTAEPTLHWEVPEEEFSQAWLSILFSIPDCWGVKKFTYPHDEPILEIKKEDFGTKVNWINETSNYKGTNQYSVTARSNFYTRMKTAIWGYIEKRYKNDNALRIRELNAAISQLTSKIAELKQTNSDYAKEIQDLNGQIQLLESDQANDKERRKKLIKDLEKKIQSRKVEIDNSKKHIENAQKEGWKGLKIVDGHYDICPVLDRPENSDFKPQVLYLYETEGILNISTLNQQSHEIDDFTLQKGNDIDELDEETYNEIISLLSSYNYLLTDQQEEKLLKTVSACGYGNTLSIVLELDAILDFNSALINTLKESNECYINSKSNYEKVFDINRSVSVDEEIINEWKKSKEEAQKKNKKSNTNTFFKPKNIAEAKKELEQLKKEKKEKESDLERINLRIEQLEDQISKYKAHEAFFGSMKHRVDSNTRTEVDEHWYVDDEMNRLLNHYIGQKQEVELLTAMLATDTNRGNDLKDNLIQSTRNRLSAVSQGQQVKDNFIIPINLDQNHWSLLYVIFQKDAAELPSIYYFDPFGSHPPIEVAQAIQGVPMFKGTEIVNIGSRLQEDGFNCGPWVIEAAKSIVNIGGIPEIGKIDITAARREHMTILERNYPHRSSWRPTFSGQFPSSEGASNVKNTNTM